MNEPPTDLDSFLSVSAYSHHPQYKERNSESIDISGKAYWPFSFQDSHNGNIHCQVTFKSVSLVFPQCGKDLEWPDQFCVWTWHLQPECRDQVLKVGQWSWLLRIHSKMQLCSSLGPAFTFPTHRLLREKPALHFPPLSHLLKWQALFQLPPRAWSVFSTDSGSSHVNLSAHSRDYFCAAFPGQGGWLLSCAFLSPLVQILPRSFPCWLASFPCFLFLTNMLVRLDKAQHLSKQAM